MALGNSFQEDKMMSEINVTPLVDVMLVLLVVFIITAPLLSPQSLKINLPKTESVTNDDRLQKASLEINAHGDVSIDAKLLNDEELAVMLSDRASDRKFQLQIQADEAVNYGRVAQVMAIAQKEGVRKLSFITISK